jgi:hypothetical protein
MAGSDYVLPCAEAESERLDRRAELERKGDDELLLELTVLAQGQKPSPAPRG